MARLASIGTFIDLLNGIPGYRRDFRRVENGDEREPVSFVSSFARKKLLTS